MKYIKICYKSRGTYAIWSYIDYEINMKCLATNDEIFTVGGTITALPSYPISTTTREVTHLTEAEAFLELV
jgi:hypothetical protein